MPLQSRTNFAIRSPRARQFNAAPFRMEGDLPEELRRVILRGYRLNIKLATFATGYRLIIQSKVDLGRYYANHLPLRNRRK